MNKNIQEDAKDQKPSVVAAPNPEYVEDKVRCLNEEGLTNVGFSDAKSK